MIRNPSLATVEDVLQIPCVGGHASSWWIHSCRGFIAVEIVLPFFGIPIGGHVSCE